MLCRDSCLGRLVTSTAVTNGNLLITICRPTHSLPIRQQLRRLVYVTLSELSCSLINTSRYFYPTVDETSTQQLHSSPPPRVPVCVQSLSASDEDPHCSMDTEVGVLCKRPYRGRKVSSVTTLSSYWKRPYPRLLGIGEEGSVLRTDGS